MLKQLVLTLTAAATLASSGFAAPAVPGTLASYLALGPGGATIGSTLFSDFTLLPTQAGAFAINPNSVLVNPINLFNNPSLTFVVNQAAAAGQLFELRLSYKVTDASILGAGTSLNGSAVVPDGANTSLLDLTGSPGLPTLIAFDIGIVSDNPVTASFASVITLNAEADIVIDGGTAGSASLVSATNSFVVAGAPGTPIPEPGSALVGLAVLGVCASRFGSRRR